MVDENTLQLKLTKPTGALLSQLCFLYIVDEQTIENGGDMEETPIGTGPFVFDQWYRGDRIDLKTNTGYWGTVAPSTSPLTTWQTWRPTRRSVS